MAPDLVLLHGFAGTPLAWDDVVAAWPAAVAARATTLALPGHDGGPPPTSWDDAVARVAADVAARCGPRATAIGYSLGARIALGLLARGAVARAVLISVNPGLPDTDDDDLAARAARRADDARWAALLRDHGVTAFAAAWQAQPLFATQAAADPARRARRAAARAALDPEGLARSLETMGLAAMPDLRGALAARAGDAALVVGDRDEKFVTLARAAVARAPALRLEVVVGSGHDPTLEAPEALARIVAGLIAGPSD